MSFLIISYKRTAPFSDVQKVIRSLSQAEYHYLTPRGRYIESPNLKARVVVYDDRKPVGFIEGVIFDDAPKTLIVSIAVSPQARHQGLAANLLDKIVAEKAYLDFDTLFARVDKVNVASQRLLEKNGFTQIRDNGSQYVYTKNVLATPVYKLWKKEKT